MRPSLARLAAALAVLAAVAGAHRPAAPDASAFALYPIRDGFVAPVRWNNTPRSLADDGIRGLGGGLEYAVAPDFCDRLLPAFVDEPKPTCADLTDALRAAMDEWAAGHPVLRFVDVTDRVPAERALDRTRGIRGAELDFVAVGPAEDDGIAAFGGLARTFVADPASCACLDGPLVTTAGERVAGMGFVASDLLLNDARCYAMDPARVDGECRHFPSLVRFLVGQAIGLDRADPSGRNNYDSDDDPTNEVAIDCRNAQAGLRLSAAIDPRSALNANARDPRHVPTRVTNDDRAGRDFLYPVCAG